MHVGTLQLQEHLFVSERHDGEIFGCAFAPDGQTVLSAGWDGQLRYWNVATGDRITSLKVSDKPLSACGFAPDGRSWLSGSMEGLLGIWSPDTRESILNFLAHTRPISSLCYSPDTKLLATTSWDRQIMLRKVGKEREGRALSGHVDIVAGCRFLPDGKQLLSWSYDGTLRLWDVDLGRELAVLGRHEDRVTAAALAPDGNWAISGSRDGMVKLWDLQERVETASAKQTEEVRGIFFMLDGEAIVTIDANGWMALLKIPSFELLMDIQTGVKPMCADQAPSGEQFVLGCEDGSLRFVAVVDYSHAPIAVTPSKKVEETSTFFGRLLGKKRRRTKYHYTCPICRHEGQALTLPAEPVTCPMCSRKLRLLSGAVQLQEK
jgi:WD40 repeat protein